MCSINGASAAAKRCPIGPPSMPEEFIEKARQI
jgi:hypothetical protein